MMEACLSYPQWAAASSKSEQNANVLHGEGYQ